MTSPTPSNAETERRARLLAIKLNALVRDHLGAEPGGEPRVFAPGAALVAGDDAWVLVDEAPEQSFGRVLAWALKAGVRAVHVLADRGTGTLARHAGAFDFPAEIWHVNERSLLPAVAEPLPVAPPVPAAHDTYLPIIVEAGAEPVVEHGVLSGEVRGLEVCRAVTDVHTGQHRLEVGIGAHDREAFLMLHGNVPTVDALRGVVAAVEPHRSAGAPPHPLNRLAAERLLRWKAVHEPASAGASDLAIAAPPVPRANVKDAVPCVARGVDVDGQPMVVVCSTGVDLSVAPFATDARADVVGEGGDPAAVRCVVLTPQRDVNAVTRRLAAIATPPVEVAGWPIP